MPRRSAKTAMPAPMPAFAAVLRSGWDSGVGIGVVLVVGTDTAVIKDVSLVGPDPLGVAVTIETLCELTVTKEETEAALVDAATFFPTVAASVNNLELVLQ